LKTREWGTSNHTFQDQRDSRRKIALNVNQDVDLPGREDQNGWSYDSHFDGRKKETDALNSSV